jgi:virginiamycin A acetyltransferase
MIKSGLKRLGNLFATLAVLPALLLYRLGASAAGPDKAFPGWSQAFSLIPGVTGVYLRRAFYRMTLARCEPDVCITFGTIFSHPGTRVGRGVYTGAYCCVGNVLLEDDVLLSSFVSVMGGGRQHGTGRLDVPIRSQPGVPVEVVIGQGSWVGERAVVMADVGEHCVIGAGAVVTRPVPDFAIAMGVPARVVGYRNRAEMDVAI